MQDHSVIVEPGETVSRLRFPPRFNAAVAFIDRHLAEGRGAAIAIRTPDADVTYAELAERVARCGNALLAAGLARGERMLMAVLDRPEFFYLFWGAVKAGIIPVPLNTLLRDADYRYMIADAAAAAVDFSPELAPEMGLAVAATAPRISVTTDALPAMLAAAAPSLAPAPTGPDDDCYWL